MSFCKIRERTFYLRLKLQNSDTMLKVKEPLINKSILAYVSEMTLDLIKCINC